jgi:hypothetical protein
MAPDSAAWRSIRQARPLELSLPKEPRHFRCSPFQEAGGGHRDPEGRFDLVRHARHQAPQ